MGCSLLRESCLGAVSGLQAGGSRLRSPSSKARAERRSATPRAGGLAGWRAWDLAPRPSWALTQAGGTGAGCSVCGWVWASFCGRTGAAVPCDGLVGADSHIW